MVDDSNKIREKLDINDDENLFSVYLKSGRPVFIVNRKGNITDVNDAFCKKIGIKSDDIVGRNIENVSFLTDEARKNARLRHVSRLLGKETPEYSLDAITKTGEIVSMDIDTKPIIQQGRVTGELGIVTKMTKISEKTKTAKEKVPKKEMKENIELLNAFEKIKQKDDEIRRMKSEMDKKFIDVDSHKKN